MRTPTLLVVLTLSIAWNAAPLAAEDAPRTVRQGEHFRVIAHFEGAPKLVDEALATVEALWPHGAKLYGLAQGKLDDLLEVNLYRDAAGYEIAEERLTGGTFKRNLAFVHWDSQTAHVALQPDLTDDALAAIGLPLLTRNGLLHEAAHLMRFHALANFRSHPDWYADGIAQWLKYETMRSLRVITSEDADPTSATAIARAQQALDEVSLDRILADDLDGQPFYTRYAIKRLLVAHLMRAHGSAMRRFAAALKRMGGGGDFKQRARDALAKSLGKKAMAGLERAFGKSVRDHEPVWSEVYRSLETVGAAWTHIAFPRWNAIAWRRRPVGKERYVFTADIHFLPNFAHQANILLDKRKAGFVSISVKAGFGVNVFSYDAQQDNWQSRASKKVAGIEVGKRHALRVEVDGARVQVFLADKPVADVSFPERKGGLTGPWGLGAQSGTALEWHAVSVK